MAPKSVTFRRHDHLVSVLFGDLLSHSYNIIFSMFLYLVTLGLDQAQPHQRHTQLQRDTEACEENQRGPHKSTRQVVE